MFDVSFSEIAVVGAVALFAVGPKELPQVLRGIGRAFRGIRKLAEDFRNSIEEAAEAAELGEIRKDLNDIRGSTRVIYDAEGRPFEAYDVDDALAHGRRATPEPASEPASESASLPQADKPLDGGDKSV